MATAVFTILAAVADVLFSIPTIAGSIVMRAEGDGGSNSGGGDDLGWGSGDIDLPF